VWWLVVAWPRALLYLRLLSPLPIVREVRVLPRRVRSYLTNKELLSTALSDYQHLAHSLVEENRRLATEGAAYVAQIRLLTHDLRSALTELGTRQKSELERFIADVASERETNPRTSAVPSVAALAAPSFFTAPTLVVATPSPSDSLGATQPVLTPVPTRESDEL
jgi:hypothetical protein